jgi:endoglucanase Acf2
MIKGLTGSGSVVVSSGNASVPYVSQNPSNPMQGMVRINGTDMQVFDSSSWINISSSYASVELTPEVESLLSWARQKQAEERKLKEMLDKVPALKKAQENLDLIWNLVKDEQYKDTV